MLKIYVIERNRLLDTNEYVFLYNFISEEKKKRIMKYRNYADMERSLLADLLVRYAVNQKIDIPNSHLHFYQNDYGKPFLMFPNIHFNASHSGNWIACAVSDYEVGIDVEKISHVDEDIAEHFFTEIENQYLKNQPDLLRKESFYKLWTLKESYIKFKGKGLSIPLDSFSIQIDKENISVFEGNTKQNCRFFLKPLPNAILSICFLDKQIEKPHFFTIDDFSNHFFNSIY
ncbi:4'-phosphopantetheinyl transferase family protein [Anaerosacchariphilus polymeriproducens]|uniref:4'-phosphopantetheinyl transferase n=1 Tax=Anaerosacchariphilus polymeriproducens TaxID=1812858 RepID=A0A371AZ15_9FIRM|nr:4'-phosphopantetheinyl transferase superfamily protein [Anaerosacchariphilus polymeriproducens]RDU24801.1 4'-phosphopantetheinyl transferase [Anaerosacchariphilus polymeriproducens]